MTDILLTETNEESSDQEFLLSAPFKNDIGDQNCFVNVILHLFHYTPELKFYFETEDFILDNDNYNLLIEIQKVLEKYKQLTSKIYYKKIPKNNRFINIISIRGELDYLFENEKMFRIGEIGEPSDIFYIFLSAIHAYVHKEGSLMNQPTEKCTKEECLTHKLFFINFTTQTTCLNCEVKSDFLVVPPNNYLFDIDVNTILIYIENLSYFSEFNYKLFTFTYDYYMKDTKDEKKICECQTPNYIKNYILVESKDYFAVNLKWNTMKPKLTEICKLFFSIPQIFKNNELFTIYNNSLIEKYFLYGMICFCDNHYVSFYMNLDEKEKVDNYWIYNEDMKNEKFENWKEIVIYCIQNMYYPKMLFYKKLNSDLMLFDDIKNYDFDEEDFFEMFNHSLKIDRINLTNYNNENNKKNILRFNENFLYKSTDESFIKSVNDMRINNESLQEKRKNKLNEEEKEIYEELQKLKKGEFDFLEDKKIETPIKRKIFEKDKNLFLIDKDELKKDEFRNKMYDKNDCWICEKCKNINSKKKFECLKCKIVDMKIFDLLEESKKKSNSNNNSNTNELNKKNNLKNKKKNDKNIKNSDLNKKFKEINEINSNYELKNKNKKNEIIIKKNWKCKNCNFSNINYDYCENCLKNKII